MTDFDTILTGRTMDAAEAVRRTDETTPAEGMAAFVDKRPAQFGHR